MTKNERLEYLIEEYSDMVLRLSYNYFKNFHDAQDVSQIVFTKLYTNDKTFKDSNHEKAFILRVTANVCKDILKSSWKKKVTSIDSYNEFDLVDTTEDKLLSWVNELDYKYRIVIYLHYYEGYKANEISKIIGVPAPTVYTRLIRGREKLKAILTEGDFNATI